MQDQLTGGSTNLQQQQGNLQQNTPNLQQSGTSTSTYDTSGLLSESPPTNELRVVTTTTTAPTTVQSDTTNPGNDLAWGWLILIPLVIIVVLIALWPRRLAVPAEVLLETEGPEVLPAPQPKKTSKAKKKSGKRKKAGRR
jgi:hypothetical protein